MPRTSKHVKDDLPLCVIEPSFMDVLQLWKNSMTPEREALLAIFKQLPRLEQSRLTASARNGKIDGSMIRATWTKLQESESDV